jgi:hypothetical protein
MAMIMQDQQSVSVHDIWHSINSQHLCYPSVAFKKHYMFLSTLRDIQKANMYLTTNMRKENSQVSQHIMALVTLSLQGGIIAYYCHGGYYCQDEVNTKDISPIFL